MERFPQAGVEKVGKMKKYMEKLVGKSYVRIRICTVRLFDSRVLKVGGCGRRVIRFDKQRTELPKLKGEKSMQLSRKADYALRAVAYVAQLKKMELASIGRIARARNIPREFLAKILKELTRAGILVSYQGVTGGYRLARSPKDISFLDVIEAMEGPVAVNLCVDGSHCDCTREKGCEIRPFFVKQQDNITRALRRQTFANLNNGR
jgi:Rrf2 family protein